MNFRVRFILILALLIFLGVFQATLRGLHPAHNADQILYTETATPLYLFVADTEQEREKGLGDREPIKGDEGMLFVFSSPDLQGIWMKGMRFPLDILWLQKTGTGEFTVVDMRENIAPDTYPEVFFPRLKVSYVLELKGGSAGKYGIGEGSMLTETKK